MKLRVRVVCILSVLLLFVSMTSCGQLPQESTQANNEPNVQVINYGIEMKNSDYVYTINEDGITLKKYIGTGKEITIPQTIDGYDVVSIGQDCFSDKKDILSVELSGKLKTIQSFAFYRCDKLSKLIIKNGLKIIGRSAFAHCTALEAVTLPESVTKIGECAFANCTELKTVSFAGRRELQIGAAAFSETAIEKIVLPEGTTTISNAAFINCKKLKEVYLPNSLSSVKSNAFKKSPKVVLYAASGTYGESFAKTNGIKHKTVG